MKSYKFFLRHAHNQNDNLLDKFILHKQTN